MAHKHPSIRALQRQVSWGEMLDLTVNRTGPGLKPLVEYIGTATGGWLGSRNTFAKLFDLADAPDAATRNYDRAYALLVAIGQEPADWGIDEDLVSEVLRRGRDLLVLGSRWITALADQRAFATASGF